MNEPNNTKFFNDKPERKDTGIYKITAINQYGSDTAEVEVTVTCTYATHNNISLIIFQTIDVDELISNAVKDKFLV